MAGQGSAQRLAQRRVQGFERVGEALRISGHFARKEDIEVAGANPPPLLFRRVLAPKGACQNNAQDGCAQHTCIQELTFNAGKAPVPRDGFQP